ncbi:alpha-ketoacid dehydrogenase kinase [Rhizodiscina lignyota]|uniref:Protein-serine/threonine kinase n=1 Tax=Rhizodiscina lignyota TaxID=1504668 RepID=A0A9P4I985_9PEZI|nr:alpha-ketoacid dehydrogenase kinase [Rhizodiscina lignyota]
MALKVKRLLNARSLQGHFTRRAPVPIHLQCSIRCASASAHVEATWRPSTVLDEWVRRDPRPISLRQLTFFGRTLTEERLISSANYVRTEVPTRIAHRLRDIQALPYVVVQNPHIKHVYETYYKSFDRYRRTPEVKTLADNEKFCDIIRSTLHEHLTVIPRLAMGVLEVQGLMRPEETDKFMTTMLRNRISRRVIAEQHLALTDTFNSPWHFPNANPRDDANLDFVGEVFLRCNAKEVVERVAATTQNLMRETYGEDIKVPEVKLQGHMDATFPYILSHLEYIIGELLRNSIQAVTEHWGRKEGGPPPIEVLICETSQHVIIRISDQGGGIPGDILPHLWSFSKGPRRDLRMQNLSKVPTMAATLQEVRPAFPSDKQAVELAEPERLTGSLASLTTRTPDLRLGIGLPMSRIYAEYWAGSLEIHSLEGYGTDAFLQISKLGNKNEQIMTRGSMDAV